MIRDFAGVLDRSGGAPDVAALARAVGPGAGTFSAGPFAVACAGGPTVPDDGAVAVLDGVLDRDPRTGEEGRPGHPETALLGAWRARGEGMLGPLRGDFSFVIWDGRRGLLARDQIGTRGLYFHDDGTHLRFATELRLLLGLLPTRPSPDTQALAHWLNVSALPGDRTLYAGLHRVPSASLLPLDPAGPRPPRRYWELQPLLPPLAPRAEHAARWREGLRVAVARRCDAPEATAVLLSGGLDSSAVAGSLPATARPQRAYSAVFPDHPGTDESALIEELCETFGLRSVRAEVRGGSTLAGAIAHIARWELPPVSPNGFFWDLLLARAAADGTRVLLDGEGGDELLGLSAPLVADRLWARDPLGALGLIYRAPGALGRPSPGSVRRYLVRAGLQPLVPWRAHSLSRRVRGPERYVPAWMGTELAREFSRGDDGGAWKRVAGPRWWARLTYVALTGPGPALAYEYIRHRAGTAGILSRHPMMDVDMVETVLTTPPELSFDPYVTRPLLREAMAGLVPERVRQRVVKSTFDPVFHASLAGGDLPGVRALLGDPRARLGEYVDLPGLRAALVDGGPPPPGPERMHWALFTWRALTAECWLRHQEDPSSLADVVSGAGLAATDVALVPA